VLNKKKSKLGEISGNQQKGMKKVGGTIKVVGGGKGKNGYGGSTGKIRARGVKNSIRDTRGVVFRGVFGPLWVSLGWTGRQQPKRHKTRQGKTRIIVDLRLKRGSGLLPRTRKNRKPDLTNTLSIGSSKTTLHGPMEGKPSHK